jgi:multiple antibiotic resistance protein
VSLSAFQVAGGIVLGWMGFSMLRGNPTDSQASKTPPAKASPSLTSLILFAASPGTITGVITLSLVHSGQELPVTALLAIAVATVVTWLVMLLLARLSGNSLGGLLRDTVTRFMGLIVLAMGVQFALGGIESFVKKAGASNAMNCSPASLSGRKQRLAASKRQYRFLRPLPARPAGEAGSAARHVRAAA